MTVVKKFAMEKNIDLLTDPLSEQRVREAVEKAKTELSTTVKTALNLPYITADAKGPKVAIFSSFLVSQPISIQSLPFPPQHLNDEFTRSKYEQLNEVHFGNFKGFLQRFLSEVDVTDLNKVVLAGSFGKTPKIQKLIQEAVARDLSFGDLEKADEHVAIGTMVRAIAALKEQQ